jgi:hypothetical protein
LHEEQIMSDEHTVDSSDESDSVGPSEQSDATTKSDAGMTGDEGPQAAEPATVPDRDDDDD